MRLSEGLLGARRCGLCFCDRSVTERRFCGVVSLGDLLCVTPPFFYPINQGVCNYPRVLPLVDAFLRLEMRWRDADV